MDDQSFINYCKIHCTTQRALFSGEDVNRMIDLAANAFFNYRKVKPGEFYSLHDEMEHLCHWAQKNLNECKPLVRTNVIRLSDYRKGSHA